tara:strand:+ start:200 stop:358 length:159 start_codon:yes stop_codon:yes gene_type:complete
MAHQNPTMMASVTTLSPDVEEEPKDTMPSEYQPPGVDEDVDYNSLEEALTGE